MPTPRIYTNGHTRSLHDASPSSDRAGRTVDRQAADGGQAGPGAGEAQQTAGREPPALLCRDPVGAYPVEHVLQGAAEQERPEEGMADEPQPDRKSTRLNSSH